MRVIISAGGTGGHIYPALAIINKIKEEDKKSEFLYIGTHNRMEKDIVPKENIPFIGIKVYGFTKNILKDIEALYLYSISYRKCIKIIKEFKPDIVIGVGGYVTVPLILAAHKLGIKTLIHEQNSIAGKANIFLSKYVDKVCISVESSSKYFDQDKVVVTGNPCSSKAIKSTPMSKESLGLSKNKKLVLIVMGSLGAKTVFELVSDTIPLFKGKDYEVLFITGKNYYNDSLNDIAKNVKVVPYIDNLSSLLKNTDLVISRAGASILSELTSLNVPSILIPSPYVPNNHQYMNALDMVNNNAAYMIEEKDLTKDKLVNTIDSIINDTKKINNMKKSLKNMAIFNSDELIYNEIKKMVK